MYSSFDFQRNGNGGTGDTTLRLDCFGYGTMETGNSQMNSSSRGKCMDAPDDGCKLVLGLGPTPTAYTGECSSYRLDKVEGRTSVVDQGVFSQRDSILKLGLSGGTDAGSSMLEFSGSTNSPFSGSRRLSDQYFSDGNRTAIPVVDDEGSTSAKKSGGYMTGLILAPSKESSNIYSTDKFLELDPKLSHCQQVSQLSSEPSAVSGYTLSAMSDPGSAVVSSDQKGCSNSKRCKFLGCAKGARGATGLCISHGGGQRCQKPGCNKGAESRTAYCKAHGGGRRCQHLGCTKSAEGKTDHCIAHGGGRRCGYPGGCTKAARGKSGLCIRHGGGKRCKIEGCCRSAEGQIGLCISHGGGRRCRFTDCTKGAQGSTLYCKAHGGGKRCIFAGCTKGSEGSTPLCKSHGGGKRCLFDGGGICPKSVHGGTNFCVAHGGGKRCAVPGCTKSARGRTDCCVRHGGGKRCKFENCGKSAQGSTDFCKAHGGGKRCGWGDQKCEKFARGKSGMCAAHASLVQGGGGDAKRGGMIGPGLFRGLVPVSAKMSSSSGVSAISESPEKRRRKRQQLIPPQVLVPMSMKSVSYSSSSSSFNSNPGKKQQVMDLDLEVPEGRVHGGGLLSLLGGNIRNANAVGEINGI
ncbi:uncharacterized protein LOC127252526 [Andrographis paniculata]|uniref:uncharacterized protein LOC127252526 n=1 Tax=Andrographis paniculata TaxID=175694 RepID=UPI0021E739BE|nr:uncharacterized protein LOC127252526 [Andrographis paniculata]XP_051132690.1 uncharacterized protein LOC127252526 [Andrographis paniculata]